MATLLKTFDKLSKPTQKELLTICQNYMDATEAFETATDNVENFQVKKEGAIKESWDYVFNELLEKVDLPYDVAYIVAGLDFESKTIKKVELDLLMAIVSKTTFRGVEAGRRLYAALVNFKDAIQAGLDLQQIQGMYAKQQIDIESQFKNRCDQVKASQSSVKDAWEQANLDHPYIVRYNKLQKEAGLPQIVKK